jgi:putative glutamine amidotransferase
VRIAVVHRLRPNDYVESVRVTGGTPVVFDWTQTTPRQAVEGADALLLTGGADVAPSLYAEAPHPTYQPAEDGRDAFEIEAIRLALERDMPMLAICRGMQVLNVVCGGTLWQDLPSERPSETPHRVKEPRDARAHVVEIAGESRLKQLLAADAAGAPSLPVNSRHHQALKHVAPGFVVTATAPDGVIEAVERPASRFCLGVQWHPENFWQSGEFLPLFAALAKAAEP